MSTSALGKRRAEDSLTEAPRGVGRPRATAGDKSARQPPDALPVAKQPLQMAPAGPPKIVVGLDIGTAFTGYAVSKFMERPAGGYPLTELRGLRDHVRTGELTGSIADPTFHDRSKGPSIVAVETSTAFMQRVRERGSRGPVHRLLQYGSDAEKTAEKCRKELQEDATASVSWDVYDDFKRPLHPMSSERAAGESLDSITRPSIIRGRTHAKCLDLISLVAGQCISRAIDHYTTIMEPGASVTPADVKVVATYPNEWDEQATSAVKRAILNAVVTYHDGRALSTTQIIPANLSQAPESLAASYSLLLQVGLDLPTASRVTHLKDDMVVLVVDAGAGTVDITCMHIASLAPLQLREVVYSRGRNLGGTTVDETIRNFIWEHVLHAADASPGKWNHNALVRHALQQQIMGIKDRFDPRGHDDESSKIGLDISIAAQLFAGTVDWWQSVQTRLQIQAGPANINNVLLAPAGAGAMRERFGYVQRDPAGSFEAHRSQRGLLLLPRRFIREVLDFNAKCIADFAEDTIQVVNATPRAATPGRSDHFQVDIVLLAGQGTVGRIHRDILHTRLGKAKLAEGQESRRVVYPTGYAMHVARGAALMGLMGHEIVQRRSPVSYGVRLRVDDSQPWRLLNVEERFLRENQLMYPSGDPGIWSVDYVAPFCQLGEEVLPGIPYYLQAGERDVLAMTPKPDGGEEEYHFQVYTAPQRMQPYTRGGTTPMLVYPEGVVPATPAPGVLLNDSFSASIVFRIREHINARLRMTFANTDTGLVTADLEEVSAAGVPLALHRLRVVPAATVTYRSSASLAHLRAGRRGAVAKVQSPSDRVSF